MEFLVKAAAKVVYNRRHSLTIKIMVLSLHRAELLNNSATFWTYLIVLNFKPSEINVYKTYSFVLLKNERYSILCEVFMLLFRTD